MVPDVHIPVVATLFLHLCCTHIALSLQCCGTAVNCSVDVLLLKCYYTIITVLNSCGSV
jgi:hypothetical protein